MIIARLKKPRRGMTVVAVLACLIVVMLVSGALLKAGQAELDLIRAQERRLQSEWLAESGLQRALARLAADHDYAGERWAVPAAELGLAERARPGRAASKTNGAAALITIAIERVQGNPRGRLIRVQADYPRDEPVRARHSKNVLIHLEPRKAGVRP
jgi:hypothetical protein